MKRGQKLWTRNEILIAINLYHKIPFGQFHSKNEKIIKISKEIGRTPSSLSLKLANIASLDESLDRKGMSNYSKLDKQVWNEFYNNIEDEVYKSEILLSNFLNKGEGYKNKEGSETERKIKVRINQSFFRSTVLSSYDYKCCLTKIDIPELLIASHIIPWSKDKKNRLNPQNGLCLNNLHDKAFDKGFITFDSNFKLVLSNQLKKSKNESIKIYFHKLEGKQLILPKKFVPDKSFLEYHNQNIFKT